MKILCITVGILGTNAYVYYDELTQEGVLIDPGANGGRIIDAIDLKEIKMKAILLTHGHFDHIGAVDELRQRYLVDVLSSKQAKANAVDQNANGSAMFMGGMLSVAVDGVLKEGDYVAVGGGRLRVIDTPGHTDGSVCFYDEENGVLFSGDTLFRESIGRTDMKTGSFENIIFSINQRLFCLPDETAVYPGHGDETTIGHEKRFNPYADGEQL